jgi:hypothetical protein
MPSLSCPLSSAYHLSLTRRCLRLLSLHFFHVCSLSLPNQESTTVGNLFSFKLSICRLYTGGSFPNFEGPKARTTENTEKSKGVKSSEHIIIKNNTFVTPPEII